MAEPAIAPYQREKKDPLPVLQEFFQSYHLKDVPEIMWNWLSAVVTSSSESLEGDDHLFFYEKVETVIEVAFVLKNKIQKHRLRKEKGKLKLYSMIGAIQERKAETINLKQLAAIKDTEETVTILNKKKRLIECVDDDPYYVIRELFKPNHWSFINYAIRDWLLITLAADCTIYSAANDRQNLIAFHDQLLLLVEAIFVITLGHEVDIDYKNQLKREYQISFLSEDQMANPKEVITAFLEKYPMTYILRELEDWLEAAISHSGAWRDDLTSPLHVLHTYRDVICLIKAAKRIAD